MFCHLIRVLARKKSENFQWCWEVLERGLSYIGFNASLCAFTKDFYNYSSGLVLLHWSQLNDSGTKHIIVVSGVQSSQYDINLTFASNEKNKFKVLVTKYLDFTICSIYIFYLDPAIVNPHSLQCRKQMLNRSNFKPILRERGTQRRLLGIINRHRNEVGPKIKIPPSACKFRT